MTKSAWVEAKRRSPRSANRKQLISPVNSPTSSSHFYSTNRAVSPTDSLGSNSAFTGKPVEPRTARQLAAAANRARQREEDDSDAEDGKVGVGMQASASTDSGLDKNGLGLDTGGPSRESAGPGRSANATPVNGGAPRTGPRARAGAGQKRSRADEEAEEGEDEIDLDQKPAKKTSTAKKASVPVPPIPAPEPEPEADTGDADTTPYCTCQRVSYGEMIGCDNDDCEYEWVSLNPSQVE